MKGKRQLSGWERAQGLSGSRKGSVTAVSPPPSLSTLSPKSKHLLPAVRAEEGCVNAAGVLPHQSGEPTVNRNQPEPWAMSAELKQSFAPR